MLYFTRRKLLHQRRIFRSTMDIEKCFRTLDSQFRTLFTNYCSNKIKPASQTILHFVVLKSNLNSFVYSDTKFGEADPVVFYHVTKS